jgi:hypothetical protein
MPQEVVDHRQAQIDRETERFRRYVWNEVHGNLRRRLARQFYGV